MMFNVRYIYSACIVISTNDLKILCDPWFTDGIYDGSWFQFPKLKNPIKKIGDVDLIYISHIHPDHYDPIFLKKYFSKFGKKKIITGNFENNFLIKKARSDGFIINEIDKEKYGSTYLKIFPNITESISDIDTALLVHNEKHGILNLNDCIYNQNHVEDILNYIDDVKVKLKLLCLAYTGAGPYPQTYYDDKNILKEESNKKKLELFERYRRYTKEFDSSYHLPFAGKYILGGNKHKLNKYRGVADAIEVKKFDNKAVVLDDGGKHYIDLINGSISKERETEYSVKKYQDRISFIKNKKMHYEKSIALDYKHIPFFRLLMKAYNNAQKKSECSFDYFIIFNITDSKDEIKDSLKINVNKDKFYIKSVLGEDLLKEKPVMVIRINFKYYFGLLTGIYHWNNAEIGSNYFTYREPNKYYIEVYNYLNYLSLI